MDYLRSNRPGPRRSVVLTGAILGVVVAALGAWARLDRSERVVERSALRVDTVKRGRFVRWVKGSGTLVPRDIRWLTADTAGRVERILVRPGTAVASDTVLLELVNPDVNLAALEAQRQLASAEAELANLRSSMESQILADRAALASLRSARTAAVRDLSIKRQLREHEVIADVELRLAEEKAAELSESTELNEHRLDVLREGIRERVAAERAQAQKLQAVAQFRRDQLERMHVRAGFAGVLQELDVEVGQWVTPAVRLGKVARPDELKAELRIPETLARDVTPGQKAEIDTHNGVAPGRVSRVAPAAREGTVLVEVELNGPAPPGSRPDLSVDGQIELERVDGALYVERPAGAQPGSIVALYRVTADGTAAERVQVRLGRASVNAIEIDSGLAEGQHVIVSDVTGANGAEKVRLR